MRPKISGDRRQRKVEPPAIRAIEDVERAHYGAWQEWIAGLTPDEKLELDARGLLEPPEPRRRKRPKRHEEDEEGEHAALGTSDFAASEALNPAEALMAKEDAAEAAKKAAKPRSADAAFEIDETTRRDLVLLGYVLPAVIDAADPRLEASLIALALGIGQRQGITVDGLVERGGVPMSDETRFKHAAVALGARVRAWQRKLDICRASLALLRVVISPILASRNPRLEAESIAMAARFGLSGGVSMTLLGEQHGVCKAAVSARVRKWVGALGLALPRECKTETDNYVLFNVRRQKPEGLEL